MTYTAKQLPAGTGAYIFDGEFDPANMKAPFDALETAKISDFPWLDEYPAAFPAYGKVGYTENGLVVLLYAKESPVLTNQSGFGSMPCHDSCLEFFVKPFADDERYLNYEFNPILAAHVGIGILRKRTVYKELIPGMEMTASKPGEWWAVSFTIPFSFIEQEFGRASGKTMTCNFYKCAEDIHPHFGCWNKVGTLHPDFHRPEYFGELILG